MTSRERVDATLAHKEPDRTPVFEYVLLPPAAAGILGRKYIDYAGDAEGWKEYASERGFENALRQYDIDRLDLAQILGHDMLYVVPNPSVLGDTERGATVPGATVPGDTVTGASTYIDDDPVERMIARNLKSEQAIENFNQDRFFVYYYLFEEMRKRDLELPVLAPAYAHGIKTDVDLMQAILLAPEVAHKHFELATRKSLFHIENFLKLGVMQIGIGGDFAGNRLIISPEIYKEFIIPELKKVSDRIHRGGGKAVNASDGNLWEVIDDFLVGSGADGYIEIDSRAGMDLGRLKKLYGHCTTFYGNMDCVEMLSFGTPDEIRLNTFEILEAGQGQGGHIFCASNAVIESIPLRNYLAMVNAYRDYFGLPHVKLGTFLS